jgi:hypothetical protein
MMFVNLTPDKLQLNLNVIEVDRSSSPSTATQTSRPLSRPHLSHPREVTFPHTTYLSSNLTLSCRMNDNLRKNAD